MYTDSGPTGSWKHAGTQPREPLCMPIPCCSQGCCPRCAVRITLQDPGNALLSRPS
jgi:hypothetical protein